MSETPSSDNGTVTTTDTGTKYPEQNPKKDKFPFIHIKPEKVK